MKRLRFWVGMSLVNLVLLALAGTMLRTKFLFNFIPAIDYRNLLSAHSHFAFGGWATLSLMILFIEKLLDAEQKQKGIYQFLLASIQLTSLGMLFSFPFEGYGKFSITFSTSFILATYAFFWVFLKDLIRTGADRGVKIFAIGALVCLVISSVGPFRLAYMMASNTGTVFQERDAVYTFLHFQYNGFFTLAILALFFHLNFREVPDRIKQRVRHFAIAICVSIIPSLFLSLLWHGTNRGVIRPLAYAGSALVVISVLLFLSLAPAILKQIRWKNKIARIFLLFALVAFLVKMLLQTGMVFSGLANAVFGFRQIIIGYLHLVFLGFLTFYILSRYIQDEMLSPRILFSRISLGFFATGIIFQEGVLLVQGVQLLMGIPNNIYGWLVWIAALALFTGAVMLLISQQLSVGLQKREEADYKPVPEFVR